MAVATVACRTTFTAAKTDFKYMIEIKRIAFLLVLSSTPLAFTYAAAAGSDAPSAVAGDWVDVTNNVGGDKWGAYGVTYIKAVPDSDMVIAGVSEVGLWATVDGGATWKKLGGSEIRSRPGRIVFDPKNPQIFYVSGCYGDAPFKTEDGGKTFQRLGKLAHADGVAIDFTDPDRKTLLLGLHEQSQSLQLSTDAGKSWKKIGDKLPADSNHSTDPIVLDCQDLAHQHGRVEAEGVARHLPDRGRRRDVDAGFQARPGRRAAGRLRRRHLLAASLRRRAAQEHRPRQDLDRPRPERQSKTPTRSSSPANASPASPTARFWSRPTAANTGRSSAHPPRSSRTASPTARRGRRFTPGVWPTT